MNQVVKIIHGSFLYGTNHPLSDTDLKGVHIPKTHHILMQSADKIIQNNTKIGNEKNESTDVDDTSFPVKVFLEMVIKGSTEAIELLYAPDTSIVFKTPTWDLVRVVGLTLINRDCKGFVGYCRRQAAKYGIKGSRMGVCEALVSLLQREVDARGTTARISEIAGPLGAFCEANEFSSIDLNEITNMGGINEILHLNCLDRKMPFTAKIKDALDLYQKIYTNYGARAVAAKENNGIDWKAVSHAVRVGEQAKELLSTGEITFPRPEAEYLKDIKSSKVDYSIVAKDIERLLDEVEQASVDSILPEVSDMALFNKTIIKLYSDQVTVSKFAL